MPTATGIKNGYLAQGDAISPASQGPDEPVVNETTIMTAPRFRQGQNVEALVRRFAATAQMHGGFDVAKRGRTFNTAKVAAGTGSTVTVTPAIAEYDAGATQLAGHCPQRAVDGNVDAQPAVSFLLDTASSSLADIPFADVVATDYNVGLAMSVVPSRATANSRGAGRYEFDQETAVLGVTATPSVVAYDSGLDISTFTLSSETLLGGGDSLAGRAAMVWFRDTTTGRPVATAPGAAIAFGTIVNTGSNQLVVSGKFGQSVASTTAADYRVCVLGPAIWSSGTVEAAEDGVAHLAYGNNSGGWDADSQRIFPTTYAILENFLEMLAPSVTSPDLVSVPKISVRPNDNEAGSTPQLEIWKDSAKTNIAFRVDKDGNITYDGVLVSPTPTNPLAFGVDDTNSATIQRAIDIFHTHNAGPGANDIGIEVGLQVEDDGGNRVDVAQISGQATDATAAGIDSILKLGRVEASVLQSDFLIDARGGIVIESKLPNADGANFYNRAPSSAPPALTVLGGASGPEPLSKLRVWNHDGSDASGARSAVLEFYGNRAAGTKMKQAEIEASHSGGLTNDLGALDFSVNVGGGAEVASRFMTLSGTLSKVTAAVPIRMESSANGLESDLITSLGTNDLEIKVDQGGAVGVGEMRFTHLSTGVKGVGNILRQTYAIEDGSSVLDVAQLDSIYVSTAAATVEFKTLANSAMERLVVYDGAEKQVTVLQDPTFVPFDSSTMAGVTPSPLQVLHDFLGPQGIDVGNVSGSNTDDARQSGIQGLGRTLAGVRHRLAGLRFAHDDPANGNNYWGKAELFVNADAADPDSVDATAVLTRKGRFAATNLPVAWGSFNGTTLDSSVGHLFAITDDTGGDYTVTFLDAFTAATYGVVLTLEDASPGDTNISYHTRTTTNVKVRVETDAGVGIAGQPFSISLSGTLVTP